VDRLLGEGSRLGLFGEEFDETGRKRSNKIDDYVENYICI